MAGHANPYSDLHQDRSWKSLNLAKPKIGIDALNWWSLNLKKPKIGNNPNWDLRRSWGQNSVMQGGGLDHLFLSKWRKRLRGECVQNSKFPMVSKVRNFSHHLTFATFGSHHQKFLLHPQCQKCCKSYYVFIVIINEQNRLLIPAAALVRLWCLVFTDIPLLRVDDQTAEYFLNWYPSTLRFPSSDFFMSDFAYQGKIRNHLIVPSLIPAHPSFLAST